jgi:hypothetical protein
MLDHDAGMGGELPKLDWVLESADDVKLRYGMDVLLIDPWINLDLGNDRDSVKEEARALAKVKSYALTRNVIVFVVTHPNREAMHYINRKWSKKDEDRKLTMHDIAGGRHWEGMSDLVVMIRRKDLRLSLVHIGIEKAKFQGCGYHTEVDATYVRGLEYFVPARGEDSEIIPDVAGLNNEGQDG